MTIKPGLTVELYVYYVIVLVVTIEPGLTVEMASHVYCLNSEEKTLD